MTLVTVFGGTGYLGRRIVAHLLAAGRTVRVAVRRPERAEQVFDRAVRQRVELQAVDLRNPQKVAAGLDGALAAVNAVSLYLERGGDTFAAVHEHAARQLAVQADTAGLADLILISGLGADAMSPSAYIRARGRGERGVREAFPAATILRPSVLFGPDDGLFAGTAALARVLPVLPLIGGGSTRLQPVHVEDVGEAVARVLTQAAFRGQTLELAGPEVLTLREAMTLALTTARRRRPLVPLPFRLAHIAAYLGEFLPTPPLTRSQVELLQSDTLPRGDMPGFAALGIAPRAPSREVPRYLAPPAD